MTMTIPPSPWFPLRTERLLLRDFRDGDFDAVHDYAVDPEVSRFMPWGPNRPEETREFLRRTLAAQEDWPRLDFNLAIELVEAATVIGSISLHLYDAANRTVEVGYCIHRAYWRRGIVSEAARAMLGAAFGPVDAHRVVATCDVRNVGSFGVMEAVGMRREGRFLRDRLIKGEWRDTYLYALLAREWRAAR
jgi:ribosomal-protein-alanine N-acetyltransferase